MLWLWLFIKIQSRTLCNYYLLPTRNRWVQFWHCHLQPIDPLILELEIGSSQVGQMSKRIQKVEVSFLCLVPGISLHSEQSNSAVGRICLFIFANILDPPCSWDRLIFASFIRSYWNDDARHLWSNMQICKKIFWMFFL